MMSDLVYACLYPKHTSLEFRFGFKYIVLECPVASMSERWVAVDMPSAGVFEARAAKLDRAALERRGTAIHKPTGIRFYSEFDRAYRNVLTRAYPIKRWRRRWEQELSDYDEMYKPDTYQIREAIDILNVSYPVTADSSKKAYRNYAKKHHPDMGGEHDEFRVGERAYAVLMQVKDWRKIEGI